MFDFRIPKNAPLRKSQRDMFNKHCQKCGISLTWSTRSRFCKTCQVIVKKENWARAKANKIAKAL